MNKVNISIKSFVERLKEIDVVELLEKAQSIKIEDLKKFKFSDFKKSKAYYPSIGLTIAFLLTNFLLIPSINKTKTYREKSKLYISELKKINYLKETLNKKKNLKEKLKEDIKNLDNLVSEKSDITDFSILLEKTSKDSNVFIKVIRPISEKEMKSICFLRKNNDGRTPRIFSENIINESNKNNNNNLAIDPSSFNLNKDRLNNIFIKSSENIGSLYRSNYFFLETESTFKDYLLFLRNLQNYKTTISSTCYLTNISRLTNKINNNKGIILNTKFILNYPTK